MKEQLSDRRTFIKALGAAALLAQIPFWQACRHKTFFKGILSPTQQAVFRRVLNILFPAFGQSPGIDQINAEFHINRYLSNPLIDPDEQQFIINGITWLSEAAQDSFSTDFLQLSDKKQQSLIQTIGKESWGESWLSKLLTLIFEALLLDPVYNVNVKQCGWQWLQHRPGTPRPSGHNIYPDILDRKKENIIITGIDQL